MGRWTSFLASQEKKGRLYMACSVVSRENLRCVCVCEWTLNIDPDAEKSRCQAGLTGLFPRQSIKNGK